jgi:preprotein translocase subunit SecG
MSTVFGGEIASLFGRRLISEIIVKMTPILNVVVSRLSLFTFGNKFK